MALFLLHYTSIRCSGANPCENCLRKGLECIFSVSKRVACNPKTRKQRKRKKSFFANNSSDSGDDNFNDDGVEMSDNSHVTWGNPIVDEKNLTIDAKDLPHLQHYIDMCNIDIPVFCENLLALLVDYEHIPVSMAQRTSPSPSHPLQVEVDIRDEKDSIRLQKSPAYSQTSSFLRCSIELEQMLLLYGTTTESNTVQFAPGLTASELNAFKSLVFFACAYSALHTYQSNRIIQRYVYGAYHYLLKCWGVDDNDAHSTASPLVLRAAVAVLLLSLVAPIVTQAELKLQEIRCTLWQCSLMLNRLNEKRKQDEMAHSLLVLHIACAWRELCFSKNDEKRLKNSDENLFSYWEFCASHVLRRVGTATEGADVSDRRVICAARFNQLHPLFQSKDRDSSETELLESPNESSSMPANHSCFLLRHYAHVKVLYWHTRSQHFALRHTENESAKQIQNNYNFATMNELLPFSELDDATLYAIDTDLGKDLLVNFSVDFKTYTSGNEEVVGKNDESKADIEYSGKLSDAYLFLRFSACMHVFSSSQAKWESVNFNLDPSIAAGKQNKKHSFNAFENIRTRICALDELYQEFRSVTNLLLARSTPVCNPQMVYVALTLDQTLNNLQVIRIRLCQEIFEYQHLHGIPQDLSSICGSVSLGAQSVKAFDPNHPTATSEQDVYDSDLSHQILEPYWDNLRFVRPLRTAVERRRLTLPYDVKSTKQLCPVLDLSGKWLEIHPGDPTAIIPPGSYCGAVSDLHEMEIFNSFSTSSATNALGPGDGGSILNTEPKNALESKVNKRGRGRPRKNPQF